VIACVARNISQHQHTSSRNTSTVILACNQKSADGPASRSAAPAAAWHTKVVTRASTLQPSTRTCYERGAAQHTHQPHSSPALRYAATLKNVRSRRERKRARRPASWSHLGGSASTTRSACGGSDPVSPSAALSAVVVNLKRGMMKNDRSKCCNRRATQKIGRKPYILDQFYYRHHANLRHSSARIIYTHHSTTEVNRPGLSLRVGDWVSLLNW
jgi:hypothetical protein